MAHIRGYTAADGSHWRQYRSMGRYADLASQDDAQEIQVWHTHNNHLAGRLSGISANKFCMSMNKREYTQANKDWLTAKA